MLRLDRLEPRDTPAALLGAADTIPTETVSGFFLGSDRLLDATVAGPGGGPVLQLTDPLTGDVLQAVYAADPAGRTGLHAHTIAGTTGGRGLGLPTPPDRIVLTFDAGGGDNVLILTASLDNSRLEVAEQVSAGLGPDFRGGLQVTSASDQPFGATAHAPQILLLPASAGYAPHLVALDPDTGAVTHSVYVGDPLDRSAPPTLDPLGGSFQVTQGADAGTVAVLVYTAPADPVTGSRPYQAYTFDLARQDYGRDVTADLAALPSGLPSARPKGLVGTGPLN